MFVTNATTGKTPSFLSLKNEILYEKKKKRRRLRLRRLGKRLPPSSPQDGQPMDDQEKEMRQVKVNTGNLPANVHAGGG